MKHFDKFVNENIDEREKVKRNYNYLIEPIRKYLEDTFNMDDVNVNVYEDDTYKEDLFIISIRCPFPDTYVIDDISKCLDSTMKNVQTLKNMETLEETFESIASSNAYLNSTNNRFKFYVPIEKINSNFYKSLKGLNKYNL